MIPLAPYRDALQTAVLAAPPARWPAAVDALARAGLTLVAAAGALLFGFFIVRLTQTYFAMLTVRTTSWGTRPATAGSQEAPA